jgi:16S rRNA processing protein RimM
MPPANDPVLMAVIGAPHGVKGELRVRSFTGDPMALGDYGALVAGDGRRFTVAAIRPQKDVVVVRFAEVADRTAAEALTGTELFVDRSALPAGLDQDEFYVADLVGLAVEDLEGRSLGRVSAVHNFGGGDIVEIVGEGRGTVMVPFTVAAVPAVDLKAGRLVVDPQAAGLLADEK